MRTLRRLFNRNLHPWIPQGSISASLLIIISINKSQIVLNASSHLYADDNVFYRWVVLFKMHLKHLHLSDLNTDI